MVPTRQPATSGHIDYRWADYDDEALLDLRFSSLGLTFRGSPLWSEVERLHDDFERRGLQFRPHVWLSTEWFSPDGIPGFAIPFYLAHPRLHRLERTMMGEVEGGNRKWRHRIMRHEAGHAIDNAYGLRRRAGWRRVFGRGSGAAGATYCISGTGMRRAIRRRTSPKRSPSGCSRRRAGAATMPAGRR
jgi:hypothetical protein